ncbi:hypothetical protein KFL_001970020 [Klebsormidium nitens]|uniref:Uncharacterized protein n=1 Tax=Klebsormidium nitens TaxID=105231 RepID=A0A1Y1I625_KLENI|nr:hypothetical protein KFL_001970020 [Klebsormidium nitens]|eukprot:GAQ84601.1 hypothetical protein KFL_001970020 [Klebsormidium nitens]
MERLPAGTEVYAVPKPKYVNDKEFWASVESPQVFSMCDSASLYYPHFESLKNWAQDIDVELFPSEWESAEGEKHKGFIIMGADKTSVSKVLSNLKYLTSYVVAGASSGSLRRIWSDDYRTEDSRIPGVPQAVINDKNATS